jgi:aromatic amino acid aminotransferase I
VELIHHPPYSDWGVCLTAGSTSAMEIVFRIFSDRGDTILTEVYTYPGAVEGAALVGVQIEGVQMDAKGAKPDPLKRILDSWDHSRGPKPTVFYTIPSGQNPTGATQSQDNKFTRSPKNTT